MGRRVTALGLAAVLAGCGVPSSGSAMGNMARDVFGPQPCDPTVWVTGVIVHDENGAAAIRNDRGDVYRLIWGSGNTAVVDWGRRYRLGGTWFNVAYETFWACAGADAVIPE